MAIGIGIGLTFGRRKGIDAQAQAAFNSLQSAGFTTPQGITGINAAFKTIKTIYGTSDITTAISFFGDPSLAYQIGAGSGTTLGQAIRTLPNIIDPTRATDAVQTTAASQPLLLTHTTGQNYWFGSGIANSFVNTPNAAANQITDNVDLIAYINGYKASNFNYIIVKGTLAAGINYSLSVNNTGLLRFNSTLQDSVSTVTLTNQACWVRATRQRSNGEIKFFFSLDSISTNPQSVAWTQLGATVIGSTNALTALTTPVTIGNFSDGIDATSFANKLYRATISNSIGGAPVVDFNPNQYNPSTSQTQWTSSTGEVWSLNVGTAATGYKGQLVTKATMQSDGIDDRMITSSYTSLSSWTNYFAYSGYTGNNAGRLIDDIAAFQRNDLVLNTSSIAAFNDGLTIASRIVNNKSFLVTQKTTSNSSLGYQNTNTPTVNLNDARAYTFSGISLFSAQNGAGFGNASLDTLLISKQADNSTQRTSIYNYIRSINGNSF